MLQLFNLAEMVYAELPFEADECQVIFVDNGDAHQLNQYVKEHLQEIKAMFRAEGLDFCYVPAMLEDETAIREQVRYRMPWLEDADLENLEKLRAVSAGEIMNAVSEHFRKAVIKIDVSQPILYRNQLEEIARSYGRKVRRELRNKGTYDPCLYKLFDVLVDKKPKGVVREIIETALGQDIVLSHVKIGGNCDVLLPDYRISVRLRPLEMTLFVFYLRHPEGVSLKELVDHKTELADIYGLYVQKGDNQFISDTLDGLFDISKNAIHEHRSRLKYAFERQMDNVVARNYYITGRKGEKMFITLPRELVEWEGINHS